jgi:hypothetical protein
MTEETERNTGFENRAREGSIPEGEPGWHRPLPEALPEPTVWPAVLAFGTCLLAWGVVTSWIISGLGLIAFAVGAGGWISRMRHEQSEK